MAERIMKFFREIYKTRQNLSVAKLSPKYFLNSPICQKMSAPLQPELNSKLKLTLNLLFAACALSSCMKKGSVQHTSSPSFIGQESKYIGCDNYFEDLFNRIFDTLSAGQEIPTVEKLKPVIENALEEKFPSLSKDKKNPLIANFLKDYFELYEVIAKHRNDPVDPITGRNFSAELSALMNGDDSTKKMKQWQKEFRLAKQNLLKSMSSLKSDCPTSSDRSALLSNQEDSSTQEEDGDGESSSAIYLSKEEQKKRRQNGETDDSSVDPFDNKTPFTSSRTQPLDTSDAETTSVDSNPSKDTKSGQTDRVGSDTGSPSDVNGNPTGDSAGNSAKDSKKDATKPNAGTSTAPPSNKAPAQNSTSGALLKNRLSFFELISQAVQKKELHPAVAGARLSMAVAYQSCKAVEQPAMSLQQKMRGVTYNQTSGWIIQNIEALVNSHYYIKNSPSPHNRFCLDNHKIPLIYDYGGKPERSDFNGKKVMNLFMNNTNGSGGSKHLGIDCSGFVSASYLTAGMKISKNNTCRPEDSQYIYTGMLVKRQSPQAYNCLADVNVSAHKDSKGAATFEWALLPGDWIVTDGHVIMIDYVGKNKNGKFDPFKLGGIQNLNQCDHLNYKNFDFGVIQSSANSPTFDGKNTFWNKGIGINRMKGADYITGDPKTRFAITQLARAACRRGLTGSSEYQGFFRVLRHRSQDPDCLCKERVQYLYEGCMDTCPATQKAI